MNRTYYHTYQCYETTWKTIQIVVLPCVMDLLLSALNNHFIQISVLTPILLSSPFSFFVHFYHICIKITSQQSIRLLRVFFFSVERKETNFGNLDSSSQCEIENKTTNPQKTWNDATLLNWINLKDQVEHN